MTITITGMVQLPGRKEYAHVDFLKIYERLHRFHPNSDGCYSPYELACKLSQFYWELRETKYRNYSVPEYLNKLYSKHMLLRVAYDGTEPVACYVVLEGELLGLISLRKGLGKWLLANAEADGAKVLDTFEGNPLEHLLSKLWKKVKTVANWKVGQPHVNYYERG